MKRIYICLVIMGLLVGCSHRSINIEDLEMRNKELESEIISLNNSYKDKLNKTEKELEKTILKNKELVEKINRNQRMHSEIKESLREEIESLRASLDTFKDDSIDYMNKTKLNNLKDQIFRYFEIEHYETIRPSEDLDKSSQISINDIKLFMTRGEVREIFGEHFKEFICYEEASGYFLVNWEYEDGTVLVFNPNYLVSIKFSNPEISSSMGISCGAKTKESLKELDKQFIKYTNIHNLDNSEDIFDFYYDEDTKTIIYVFADNEIIDYENVSEDSVITGIKIIDSSWDFHN